jgi:DNA (cytosine-5)-methyltransferase 1
MIELDDAPRTYLSLFSGVGGADLGFDNAGFTCACRVENDRDAASVLLHRHPDIPVYADIKKFHHPSGSARPLAVIGGSPCQDLSVAGLRKGLSGERSGLFRQMVRVCRALRPRHVVWENVGGALSSNEGGDFAVVIGSFTGCTPSVPPEGWGNAGFAPAAHPNRWNVAWRVLDSQYFGVPQRRRRVFLVGSLGGASCVEILFEPESVRGDSAPGRKKGEGVTGTLANRARGGGGLGTDFDLAGGVQIDGLPDVAGCLQERDSEGVDSDTKPGHLIFDTTQITSPDNNGSRRQNGVVGNTGVRRLTPTECERLQGWPDGHTARKCRKIHLEGNQWLVQDSTPQKQADGPRYKQIGNGVTASVAEWIGRRILKHAAP